MPQFFVSLVAYNSGAYLERSLEALSTLPSSLCRGFVRDNASTDGTANILSKFTIENFRFEFGGSNLGFCAAHNAAAKIFLDSNEPFFVVLNPDVLVEEGCFTEIQNAAERFAEFQIFQPVLLRGDENLELSDPVATDSLGMELRPSFRHFDRESDQRLSNTLCDEEVFAATGAFTVFRREAVQELMSASNAQLYDERFFAYREDAELGFRAQSLGLRCMLVSSARAIHRRKVLPTNRTNVDGEINRMSVRNRFLLFFLHYHFAYGIRVAFEGLFLRNALVVAGVLTRERSSLKGLFEAWNLFSSCLRTRQELKAVRKRSPAEVGKWFRLSSKPL